MTRFWRCDGCGAIKEGIIKPKGFVEIKIFEKASSKGGKSKGYHSCPKCLKEILDKLKGGDDEE